MAPNDHPTRRRTSRNIKWIVLAVTVLLALAALWEVNNISRQIRISEQQKVQIWAAAIGQKAQLVSYTEAFFNEVAAEERSKMELYTRAQQIAFTQPLNNTVGLFFTDYIIANRTIPVIVTDGDSNSRISAFNNIELPEGCTRLAGDLYTEFTHEEPIPYRVWGMPFVLYYKESRIYTDLRKVLNSLTQSLLDEITNNSVAVPVLVVDSLQEYVIGSGNLREREFDEPDRLANKLCEMAEENDPIEIRLPDNNRAYVFYESTPLLKALRWVPLLYIFIILVLLLVS